MESVTATAHYSTKSWAHYSQLNSDGDAQYYTFNVTARQKIHVTMFKSMRPEDARAIQGRIAECSQNFFLLSFCFSTLPNQL
jgi:hypothetical protein